MPFWIRRPAEAVTGPDADRAYAQGRRDARADRKRHPIGMALLFVLAAVGAVMIGLAAMNGSFSDGGQVADQGLDAAAERAAPVVEEAVQDAGQAIRETGRDIDNRI
jgi:predicted anti-sigma-YlaC factor YlaD